MTERETCDRVDTIVGRCVNCGWITVHNEQQFRATLRIALNTEVEAGGPYLNNGWNRAADDLRLMFPSQT
jgi:hypothetical protein